jgi:type I restriction enzyme M protein
MVAPTRDSVISDPAAVTCGFLVAAGDYLRTRHPELFRNERQRRHFHEELFCAFDFDAAMISRGKACELGGFTHWDFAQMNRELRIPIQ